MSPEYEASPITSIEEYNSIVQRLQLLEDRADKIANQLCTSRINSCRFEFGEVRYEYSSGCSCHPDLGEGTFPAEYLFDADWESKFEAAQLEAKRLKNEAEATEALRKAQIAAQKKEQADRREYERLRLKFGNPAGDDQ